MSTRGWFMARPSPAWRGPKAGGEGTSRELLLFVAQLLFAPLHLGRGLAQASHDVNHGFAAGLQTQLLIVLRASRSRRSPTTTGVAWNGLAAPAAPQQGTCPRRRPALKS